MGHVVRATTDADGEATPLSIDGVGAYDHVLRSSILAKLLEVPGLRPLLPFVRSIYARPSRYVRQDDAGQRHEVHQHEGGEQGDPLMPLLFSLAIHNALVDVKLEMRAGEELYAFLDDVYILSSPARTRFLYNLVGEKLLSTSGIQLHTGNTRCWDRMGQPPPDMEALGPGVWSPGGIKVLGTQRNSSRRRAIKGSRKNAGCGMPSSGHLPDLQCLASPLTMFRSSVPMPSGSSLSYADGRDEECQELWIPCWAAFPE